MKLQIQKEIKTPILGDDGKKTKKFETIVDVKVVHRVDYLENGSWRDQGYEVVAESGMNFKKQIYGGDTDGE